MLLALLPATGLMVPNGLSAAWLAVDHGQSNGQAARVLWPHRLGISSRCPPPWLLQVDVNGPHIAKVFEQLKLWAPERDGGGGGKPETARDVKWNFEKFIVDQRGQPVRWYTSGFSRWAGPNQGAHATARSGRLQLLVVAGCGCFNTVRCVSMLLAPPLPLLQSAHC
jgi:hypothetical protein